eukprot:scaffold3788_cov161-Prasinococcus_capsulatus_cf.AAC.1
MSVCMYGCMYGGATAARPGRAPSAPGLRAGLQDPRASENDRPRPARAAAPAPRARPRVLKTCRAGRGGGGGGARP